MPITTIGIDSQIAWEEYLYNPGGCLVMECPECKRCHYRDAVQVLRFGHKEYCVWCPEAELLPVKEGSS